MSAVVITITMSSAEEERIITSLCGYENLEPTAANAKTALKTLISRRVQQYELRKAELEPKAVEGIS